MHSHFEFLKTRLAKEIGLILLLKLILLMGIRSIWFDAPVDAGNDVVKVGQHLLGVPPATPEKTRP